MKENESPELASSQFAQGVDISGAHGVVKWKNVAASGVAFGYVIATRGAEEQSKSFAENWKEMGRAGIIRGAYHYFQPLQDAEGQARHFSKTVGALEDNDLPPALRLKAVSTHTGLDEWDGVRKDQKLAVVLRCLASIESEFGRKPVIFTNGWFLSQLGDPGALRSFDLWIADYSAGAAAPRLPAPWDVWTFWRYAESGSIPGIEGRVGLDYFNGLRSALGRSVEAEQTPEPEKTEAAVEEIAGQPAKEAEEDNPPGSESPGGPLRAGRSRGRQTKRES